MLHAYLKAEYKTKVKGAGYNNREVSVIDSFFIDDFHESFVNALEWCKWILKQDEAMVSIENFNEHQSAKLLKIKNQYDYSANNRTISQIQRNIWPIKVFYRTPEMGDYTESDYKSIERLIISVVDNIKFDNINNEKKAGY